MPSVVVDTGLFVALFNRRDAAHPSAISLFKSQRGPLVTNIPVITETVHLRSRAPGAAHDFLTWLRLALEIDVGTVGDLTRIPELMRLYSDLPADFADAALVALCERRGIDDIATVRQRLRRLPSPGRTGLAQLPAHAVT